MQLTTDNRHIFNYFFKHCTVSIFTLHFLQVFTLWPFTCPPRFVTHTHTHSFPRRLAYLLSRIVIFLRYICGAHVPNMHWIIVAIQIEICVLPSHIFHPASIQMFWTYHNGFSRHCVPFSFPWMRFALSQKFQLASTVIFVITFCIIHFYMEKLEGYQSRFWTPGYYVVLSIGAATTFLKPK